MLPDGISWNNLMVQIPEAAVNQEMIPEDLVSLLMKQQLDRMSASGSKFYSASNCIGLTVGE